MPARGTSASTNYLLDTRTTTSSSSNTVWVDVTANIGGVVDALRRLEHRMRAVGTDMAEFVRQCEEAELFSELTPGMLR